MDLNGHSMHGSKIMECVPSSSLAQALLELNLVYLPAFCDFARPPNPVESVLALPTEVTDYICR